MATDKLLWSRVDRHCKAVLLEEIGANGSRKVWRVCQPDQKAHHVEAWCAANQISWEG